MTDTVKSSATMPNLENWIMQTQMLGVGLEAYGTYMEGEIQAETQEYNAWVAMRDAQNVEKYKKHELHKSKTTQRMLLARQIAATAASGRSMSGSPLDIINRSEAAFVMDQNIITANAAHKKGRLYGEATMSRARGKVAKRLGRTGAYSGLLSGTANVYAKSNYFKKRGK